MAQVAVSKEYVRQQLNAMGVRELSEEDLEAYTNGENLTLTLLDEETCVINNMVQIFPG